MLLKKLFLLSLAGCITLSPTAPDRAYEIPPRPVWREWHQELVSCVGRERSFEAITWFAVPALNWRSAGKSAIGQFFPDGNRIYLSSFYLDQEWLVKHEMTHFLLSPLPGHPTPPFEDCEYRKEG